MGGHDGPKYALNQHVSYNFKELEEWFAARNGLSQKGRKAIAQLQELKRQRRELELELQVQHEREEVARLKKKLGRKLGFVNLGDCASSEKWTCNNGLITGHVLTVLDEELRRALDADEVVSLSLEEALCLPWGDIEQRNAFDDALEDAIESSRGRAAEGREDGIRMRGERERTMLDRLTPDAATTSGPINDFFHLRNSTKD